MVRLLTFGFYTGQRIRSKFLFVSLSMACFRVVIYDTLRNKRHIAVPGLGGGQTPGRANPLLL